MKLDIEDNEKWLSGLVIPATRQDTYKQVLRAYQQIIYWFLRRMVLLHEDADDLIHEVFVRLWKRIPALQRSDSLPLVFYSIAIDSASRFLERSGSRAIGTFLQDELFSGDDAQRILQRWLWNLSFADKLVFILYQFEGLSFSDISNLIGEDTATIKATFNKLLQQLPKEI